MIRLTGLVDIKPLMTKGGKLGKRARLAQTLAKLKESNNLSEEQLAKVNELYVALDLPGREDKDIDNVPRGSLSDTYYRKRRELANRYKMAKARKSPFLNTMNLEDLDPVGQEDTDIDNDGDTDSTDQYLQNRRDAIGQAMAMHEDVNDMSNNTEDDSQDDHEGSMAKADLLALHKQAGELYNMIGEDEQLEGWVQSKITKAADYISSVYNNMQYEKSKPNSVGNGMGAPAEKPMHEGKETDTYPGEDGEDVCPECGGVGKHNPGCPEVPVKEVLDTKKARKAYIDKALLSLKQLSHDVGARSATLGPHNWDNDDGLAVDKRRKAVKRMKGISRAAEKQPTNESEQLNEVAPQGWEATVLRMKQHKEIDNPWALAHWMKSKGYHPHAGKKSKKTKKSKKSKE